MREEKPTGVDIATIPQKVANLISMNEEGLVPDYFNKISVIEAVLGLDDVQSVQEVVAEIPSYEQYLHERLESASLDKDEMKALLSHLKATPGIIELDAKVAALKAFVADPNFNTQLFGTLKTYIEEIRALLQGLPKEDMNKIQCKVALATLKSFLDGMIFEPENLRDILATLEAHPTPEIQDEVEKLRLFLSQDLKDKGVRASLKNLVEDMIEQLK